MEHKVERFMKENRMLSPGDPVLVGLSGGADSVALLFCLLLLQKTWDLKVYACHVNHLIRGEEADRDEAFVRTLCGQQGVPLKVLRADVPALSRQRHESMETIGREIRYAFFQQTAEPLHAKIATAHTASDNVETVLYNLTRGTGLHGMCGIPPVRGNIIRPLIECSREEIETFCREHHLSYVEDSTNFSNDYTRNRIRHEVVSQLKRINPALESTVAQMTRHMRCTADYLYSEAFRLLCGAKEPGGYQANTLTSADPALFAEAVRMLCCQQGVIPEARHIQLCRQICQTGGAVQIGKGVSAVCSQGLFRVIQAQPPEGEVFLPISGQALAAGCTFVIGTKKISFERRKLSDTDNSKKNPKYLFQSVLNYDTIPMVSLSSDEPALVLRTRRPDDTFQPPRSRIHKKLRRLMMEKKIPSERRPSVLLLAHGSEVLWGEYIGSSDRCAVTETTENLLLVTVEEAVSSS